MAAIEKRGDNSYRLTVSCGYDKQGKKIIKRKTVDLSHIKPNKQLEEANKQWILFKDEVEKGIYLDSGKITFEDFINKWLKDYAEPELAPKTLFRYKEIINSRIIPALGHIKINKLQPTHLTEFYNNLRESGIRLDKKYVPKENFVDLISELGYTPKDIMQKCNVSERTLLNIKHGKSVQSATANKIVTVLNIKTEYLFNTVSDNTALSERTILHHHRIISSILTCAVQWGFILNNPASRVKAPKVEKKEARHYDIDQTEYILELLQEEPIKYRTMVTLAIYGGMREGELAALTWDDVDLKNCLLRINKSLQHLTGQGTFIKSTKNETSNRIISLPPSVIALLKNYKLWQNGQKSDMGDLWNDTNSLFTAIDGTYIFPGIVGSWFSNFIARHNKKIMDDDTIKKDDKEKYLLDRVNFHGLRHTSATILINQGMDVTTVSKRLGHARTSTTTDIYAHSLKKADFEASQKLEELFNKKNKSKKKS
ncbi:tyrosine-type recombinase/integrase [Clostridium sp. 19966]|uniref:site-specific integrase n=1 Tax=Clostridium sp. 19966 TaxID=2768166 RepID=UPI0028E02269|nr:site-specific integrase [Clostridium sp. 19966]MDT8715560.1 tyrosine-type recombinase/integrase [Clostridium sp. 19966]